MEIINYKLETYEGPLDLLLALIEKNKINIYDIPIVEITEQYLSYVTHMEKEDLDVVSDFLVMAATLIEIKSKMLLPKDENDEEGENDPRAELVQRLLEYKKYKDLGDSLLDYEDMASKYICKEATIPKNVATYIPDLNYDELLSKVDLSILQNIFLDVMKRKEDRIDKVRSGFGKVEKEKIPLETKIIYVLSYARIHKSFNFKKILDLSKSKTEVVVTFLAILELIKMGKLKIYQNERFGEIDIENVDDTNNNLDLSNLEDI
ncbi:MAG: segregation/condensation protein A [Eubacteriales bacterium]|nr:segregation/condensation protein A [Eubacteriales bacterium]